MDDRGVPPYMDTCLFVSFWIPEIRKALMKRWKSEQFYGKKRQERGSHNKLGFHTVTVEHLIDLVTKT